MTSLAEKIKSIANEHGKTISGMAGEMGVAQSHLSRTINNPRITLQDLQKIANVIGCNVSDFFSHRENVLICPHCGKPIKINVE